MDKHGFAVGDTKQEELARDLLISLEPEELFAIAYVVNVHPTNKERYKSREKIIEECLANIMAGSVLYRASFNALRDSIKTVQRLRFLDKVNDVTARRAAELIRSHVKSTTVEMQNIFPFEGYGKKELLAELLLVVMETHRTGDITTGMSDWFSSGWLEVITKDEFYTRDKSPAYRAMFLEEINSHLAREPYQAQAAINFQEAALRLDSIFGNDAAKRQIFIDKAKKSLAQRKHRNKRGGSQKSFSFTSKVKKALKDLSEAYGLSETQTISLLIVSEEETPHHLTAYEKRQSTIDERTGLTNRNEA